MIRIYISIPVFVLCCLTFLFTSSCFAANDSTTAAKVLSLDEDDTYLDSVGVVIPDPIEGFNRAVFVFNDRLYRYVAHPINTGYTFITPKPVRTGIGNFFHNLLFPVRFVNNLLQGKGKAAGVEMSLFVLNTTAGLGGFIDVGKNHKTVVPVTDEDMGQTFGVWGMGEGFYLVLPFFGPGTARDTVGMVGDYFLNPISYVQPFEAGLAVKGVQTVNDLEGLLDRYDDIRRNSVEPYSSFKNAYVQYRRAAIAR